MPTSDVTGSGCHTSRGCLVVSRADQGADDVGAWMIDHGKDFEHAWVEHRAYVVDLAFRMLGSIQDAEDVVQDAFGRLLARDLDEIDDVRGWLVVVVSRLCLDQLRSARVRHASGQDFDPEIAATPGAVVTIDPADRVTLDDSIRIALLVVLQQLAPAERAV